MAEAGTAIRVAMERSCDSCCGILSKYDLRVNIQEETFIV